MALSSRLESSCFAKDEVGTLHPFELWVSAPFPHEKRGWQGHLLCPTFREIPVRIYGSEKELCWDIMLGFIHQM